MEIMARNNGNFFQIIQEWVIEIVKIRKKQIVQDSFAMFYRSGFLKNLSLASMKSHMDRGRRDNIDVVLEAISKDYFPKRLSEEEKGIGIQTAFSLASLSLLQSFSIEKRKEGLSDPEDNKEQEAFIEQILHVFQKQIQLLEKALGGKE